MVDQRLWSEIHGAVPKWLRERSAKPLSSSSILLGASTFPRSHPLSAQFFVKEARCALTPACRGARRDDPECSAAIRPDRAPSGEPTLPPLSRQADCLDKLRRALRRRPEPRFRLQDLPRHDAKGRDEPGPGLFGRLCRKSERIQYPPKHT